MMGRGPEVEKDAGSPRAPLPCPGSSYLGSGLRAVMLATMMLSGRGVATALKVPLQNFSKSCFSPCCTPAMTPRSSGQPPAGPAAVRGAERYIPGPARSPARCGECGPGRPRLPFCAGGAGTGAGPAAVPSPAPPPPQLRPERRSPARGGGGSRGPATPLGSCRLPRTLLTLSRGLLGGFYLLAAPRTVRAPSPSFPSPAERPLPARCWIGGTAAFCPFPPGQRESLSPHRGCQSPSCLPSHNRTREKKGRAWSHG